MEKMKERFLALMGIAALTLALLVSFAPEARAAGTKQWVKVSCSGGGETWSCNDCDPGKKACSDNICSDCQSGDPQQ